MGQLNQLASELLGAWYVQSDFACVLFFGASERNVTQFEQRQTRINCDTDQVECGTKIEAEAAAVGRVEFLASAGRNHFNIRSDLPRRDQEHVICLVVPDFSIDHC